MWFRSYPSGRTYGVVYAGGTSSAVYIVCSVPQGSVLGPILYVADLVDIINRHDVTLHSFADDTQLYVHCCRDDISTAATRLKECIMDVGRWMSTNRLKLNTDKTLSCCGLGPDTAYLNSMAMVHLYNWAPILSQLVTM